MKFLQNTKAQYTLSFMLGLTLVFGFSPFNLWPLGLVLPALLFCLVENKTPKQAFALGFLFGTGEFGFGISWIYVSLAHYGNGIFLAGLITLAFILILALFPALQMALIQQPYFTKRTRPIRLLFIYPALWLIFELLRSTLFTGFPWLLLGYTQTFTPLAGFAKVFSVFGVSFITVLLSGLLLLIWPKSRKKLLYSKIPVRQAFYSMLIALIFIIGGILRNHQFTHPVGNPIQVALIQGNISEDEKWQPDAIGKILTAYANLIGPNLNHGLIILPENAFPIFPEQILNFINVLDENARLFKSAVVFGIPVDDPATGRYFNGAIALGDANGMYLKQHLVPLGEYLPYSGITAPLFSALNIPMSDFSKGSNRQPPMLIHGLPVRIFICYESAYPFLFRQAKDSAYIITLTDDAWFGHSLGPYQHEEIEVMRAIETGRPILRSTNTGITSIIDQNGKIIAKAPMFQVFTLTGQIQAVTGETPWLRM